MKHPHEAVLAVHRGSSGIAARARHLTRRRGSAAASGPSDFTFGASGPRRRRGCAGGRDREDLLAGRRRPWGRRAASRMSLLALRRSQRTLVCRRPLARRLRLRRPLGAHAKIPPFAGASSATTWISGNTTIDRGRVDDTRWAPAPDDNWCRWGTPCTSAALLLWRRWASPSRPPRGRLHNRGQAGLGGHITWAPARASAAAGVFGYVRGGHVRRLYPARRPGIAPGDRCAAAGSRHRAPLEAFFPATASGRRPVVPARSTNAHERPRATIGAVTVDGFGLHGPCVPTDLRRIRGTARWRAHRSSGDRASRRSPTPPCWRSAAPSRLGGLRRAYRGARAGPVAALALTT